MTTKLKLNYTGSLFFTPFSIVPLQESAPHKYTVPFRSKSASGNVQLYLNVSFCPLRIFLFAKKHNRSIFLMAHILFMQFGSQLWFINFASVFLLLASTQTSKSLYFIVYLLSGSLWTIFLVYLIMYSPFWISSSAKRPKPFSSHSFFTFFT